MEIRHATPQDGKRLKALWMDMCFELAPTVNPNPEWWQATFMRNLSQANVRTLVAVEQGKLVGFLQYMFFVEPGDGKKHVHGTHLYMRPEHRGKKQGFKMVAEGIRDAKQNKAQVIELMANPAQVKMDSHLVHAAQILRGRPVHPDFPSPPGELEAVRLDARNSVEVDISADVTPGLLALMRSTPHCPREDISPS